MRFRHLLFFGLTLSFFACSEDNAVAPVVEPETFNGEVVSATRFGGSLHDRAAAIIELNTGGLGVLATSESTDGMLSDKTREGEDYWFLQLDAATNLISSKTYGGSGGDVATDLIATQDGGFLLGGYSMSKDGDASKNEGFHDTWFVKTNASGGIEWEKSYGFAGHDHSYSVLETADGGYFSAGFLDVTASGGAGNENVKHGVGEFWGQKLDATGNLQWRNYFGGSNNDRSYKAIQTPDAGFLLVGFTESDDFDISSPHGSYDIWLVKLNSTGSLVWERSFGGSGVDIAHDALMLPNGDFLIVGQTNSSDGDISDANGDFDAFAMRVSAEGTLIWQQNYGSTDFEFAQSITLGPSNTFFVTGNTRSADITPSGNAGNNDIWAFQITDEGDLRWQQTWGGSGIDLGVDAVFSQDQFLYIIGSTDSPSLLSTTTLGNDDLLILRLN